MAWYWWLLIVAAIFGLIGAINSRNERIEYEEETSDAMNRLAALVIIDDLKYSHPEIWARCASNIMGRQIDTPTPEQVAKWNEQRKQK